MAIRDGSVQRNVKGDVLMPSWNWRRCRGLAAAFVASTITLDTSIAVEADDDLSAFLSTYQCAVADMILRIHAHPHPKDYQDRFIILSQMTNRSDYVQCAFDHEDRQALCEAASGFYAARGEAPHLEPGARQVLARLGFSTDGSHGNFQQQLHFQSGADPDAIARLMLTALYGGYGARKGDAIEVVAPYVTRHGVLPKNNCVPVS